MSILGSIAGAVVKPLGDYVTKREERRALESQLKSAERIKMHELNMAQLDRQIQLRKDGLLADASWEMEFARQAESSWKDEYTLLVVSLPAILCFIPDAAIYVKEGFAALSEAPLWYQGMFISLFLATVGIRYWRRTQSDS